MATWVMFFVVWGKFGTSSISVDFTTEAQCKSARAETAKMIPSNSAGYFQYSACYEK